MKRDCRLNRSSLKPFVLSLSKPEWRARDCC